LVVAHLAQPLRSVYLRASHVKQLLSLTMVNWNAKASGSVSGLVAISWTSLLHFGPRAFLSAGTAQCGKSSSGRFMNQRFLVGACTHMMHPIDGMGATPHYSMAHVLKLHKKVSSHHKNSIKREAFAF
jgi:hypothetical protein